MIQNPHLHVGPCHCRWVPIKKEKSRDFPESFEKKRRRMSNSITTKLVGTTQLNFAATRPDTS